MQHSAAGPEAPLLILELINLARNGAKVFAKVL